MSAKGLGIADRDRLLVAVSDTHCTCFTSTFFCVNESIENGDFAKYLPQQYEDLMQQVVQDEISATITHTHHEICCDPSL